MRNPGYFLLLFVVGIFVLGGCRTNPVQNIDDASISIGDKYTEADVKRAISTAAASLGWQMKEASPGHMVGKLLIREHMAAVDIKYTKKKYSITYKDSANLNYDGATIHSNYNGWIQRLNQNIQAQLSTLY